MMGFNVIFVQGVCLQLCSSDVGTSVKCVLTDGKYGNNL